MTACRGMKVAGTPASCLRCRPIRSQRPRFKPIRGELSIRPVRRGCLGVAVALVLDVSPLFLVVPPLGSRLRIGKEALDAKDVRAWWRGEKPLADQLPEAFAAQRPEDEIPIDYRAAVRAYRPPKEEQ
jgi:hypothetical protein